MKFNKIFLPFAFIFIVNINAQETTNSIDELNESVGTSTQSLKDSAANQRNINTIDKQTRELEFDYKDTYKEYENLKLYNDQLQKIINSQNEEIESIILQIAELDNTNINIIPLMLKMTASLEQFISLDIPFLLEERTSRIENIKEVMDRGDVSTSEKFRKVAEAYQIENDYGRTIEAYRGSVNFEGKEFNADFLRVGRVALMFITTNGDKAAYWDTSSNSWVKSSGAIKRSTEEGLKIALKQSPPALINIPVTAYEKNN
tara:strand:+ start:42 stop:821 length:780 start_codon:yes stop_codon:yes gene_type:complete